LAAVRRRARRPAGDRDFALTGLRGLCGPRESFPPARQADLAAEAFPVSEHGHTGERRFVAEGEPGPSTAGNALLSGGCRGAAPTEMPTMPLALQWTDVAL